MSFSDFIRQVSMLLSLPAVVIMAAAAAAIVIVRDWRVVLFAYAVLSAVLSLLLSQAIPTEWALLQAITGGLIAVMLFLSARQLRGVQGMRPGRQAGWPQLASLTGFRLLTVTLAAIAFFVVRDRLQLPAVNTLYRDALLWLVLMGVVGLALHEEPMHAGLALLMVLSGFILVLYQLTQQRLLVGILEAWQLLLGLAVSYLTFARGLGSQAASSHQRTSWWQS